MTTDVTMDKYDQMMEWLSETVRLSKFHDHYMHDKYYYEAAEMP